MSDIIKVPGNIYTVSSIKTESLINFETYKLKVRSVNGDWKSPWSDEKQELQNHRQNQLLQTM